MEIGVGTGGIKMDGGMGRREERLRTREQSTKRLYEREMGERRRWWPQSQSQTQPRPLRAAHAALSCCSRHTSLSLRPPISLLFLLRRQSEPLPTSNRCPSRAIITSQSSVDHRAIPPSPPLVPLPSFPPLHLLASAPAVVEAPPPTMIQLKVSGIPSPPQK